MNFFPNLAIFNRVGLTTRYQFRTDNMLKVINDLPDNVLGIEASGEVTAEDYETVLVPALEDKLSTIKRVRFLYVFGEDFTDYTGGAAWEDAKVGLSLMT